MLGRAQRAIELAAMILGCSSIAIMMVLVSVDTLGRYFFHAPLQFQFELSSLYLMPAGCLLGMAWAKRQGALIRLTGLGRFLGPRAHNVLHGLNHMLGAALFVLVAYYAASKTWTSFTDGDVIFGVIDWPTWLSEVSIPVAAILLAARLFVDGSQLLWHRPYDGEAQS